MSEDISQPLDPMERWTKRSGALVEVKTEAADATGPDIDVFPTALAMC